MATPNRTTIYINGKEVGASAIFKFFVFSPPLETTADEPQATI